MSQLKNSKRIVKNTLFLYFRTFITLLVSLYTSRVVIEVLGVTDFGIFNVVGGIVIMLSFLNLTMTAGNLRFLSFELGKNDYDKLQRTFSALITIHLVLALCIFLVAESAGLWFLNNYLNLPQNRIDAANWVFHFSVLSTIVTVIQVPFTSIIIAHEKMKVFTYIGIVSVIFKLLIVLILVKFGSDKLILYSLLSFIAIFLILIVTYIYCHKYFNETKYKFEWDKELLNNIINFSSWNTIGGLGVVVVDQGINILLNLFFGPLVNAARGIAIQVKSAVGSFVGNFQTAVNPQIIKSHANQDYEYSTSLIYNSAKYSFFLLFLISFPIILESRFVLNIWLKNVPDYAAVFCQLVLIETCIEILSGPLITAVQATGKIKKYQIIISGLKILIFPICYLGIKLTNTPIITLIISILMSIIILFARIIILKGLISISISSYYKNVLSIIIRVLIIPVTVLLILIFNLSYGLPRFIIISVSSILLTLFSIYIIGLNNYEQKILKNYIYDRFNKKV